MSAPARLVSYGLVHSPLVGPNCWAAVARSLRRLGESAIAIDYGGVQPDDWYGGAADRIVEAIARLAPPWALVVHSGAGALAPSILAAAPVSPAAVILVDALTPHPGRSWLQTVSPSLARGLRDLADNGLLPPWSRWFGPDMLERLIDEADARELFSAELRRLPIAFLECPAPDLALDDSLPAAFIRLSANYAGDAADARRRGLPVLECDIGHLAMVTEPDRLAAMITEATRRARGA